MKLIKDVILKSTHGERSMLGDIRYKSTNELKPIILFVHGFKGFKDWGHFNLIADWFAENGFIYVKFNLSHNGTNPENPNDFVDLNAFSIIFLSTSPIRVSRLVLEEKLVSRSI